MSRINFNPAIIHIVVSIGIICSAAPAIAQTYHIDTETTYIINGPSAPQSHGGAATAVEPPCEALPVQTETPTVVQATAAVTVPATTQAEAVATVVVGHSPSMEADPDQSDLTRAIEDKSKVETCSTSEVEPLPIGIALTLGGQGGDTGGLFGTELLLRAPLSDNSTFDTGFGFYEGFDDQEHGRIDIALVTDVTLTLNPDDDMQVYGRVGGRWALAVEAIDRDDPESEAQAALRASLVLGAGVRFTLEDDLMEFFVEGRVMQSVSHQIDEGANVRTNDTALGLFIGFGALPTE